MAEFLFYCGVSGMFGGMAFASGPLILVGIGLMLVAIGIKR